MSPASRVTTDDAEALSELERQAWKYFRVALESAVEAMWEETRKRGLVKREITIDVLAGIMHRSLDDARLQFGWL